jgi:hypothetical protein
MWQKTKPKKSQYGTPRQIDGSGIFFEAGLACVQRKPSTIVAEGRPNSARPVTFAKS